MSWVRTLPALRGANAAGSADIDYLAKVPYRSLGR
jgi:phycobilisome rod-core linker protein